MPEDPSGTPSDPFGPPCPGCGRARTAGDAVGVAWSSRHGDGGVEFVCPACTRTELREIEAGLAPAPVRQDTVRSAG